MMFPEDASAGATAIAYVDDFADAAVAKLDALFGEGYAKANPAALAAYLAACASNLNAFIIAASADPDDLSDALAAFAEIEDDFPAPPPKSKGKRGR